MNNNNIIIKKLPNDISLKVRSSVVIVSLEQAIEEIVFNSIDANSTTISISINLSNLSFEVKDNGYGFTTSNLSCIGEHNCTSKIDSLSDLKQLTTFGYRGQSLASLAEISCMEITTTSNNNLTLQRSFDFGKCIINNQVIHGSNNTTASNGTVIKVRDIFKNFPVRRQGLYHPNLKLIIKKRIEIIALSFPNILFSVYDETKSITILKTPKDTSFISYFKHFYGQEMANKLEFVRSELSLANDGLPQFHLSGFLSSPQKKGHPNKSLQYFYLNNRIVLNTKLHRHVNELYQKYRLFNANRKAHANVSKVQKKEIIDSNPIFILFLKCSQLEYERSYEPSSKTFLEFNDWKKPLGEIQNVVTKFLTKQIDNERNNDSNKKTTTVDISIFENDDIVNSNNNTIDEEDGFDMGYNNNNNSDEENNNSNSNIRGTSVDQDKEEEEYNEGIGLSHDDFLSNNNNINEFDEKEKEKEQYINDVLPDSFFMANKQTNTTSPFNSILSPSKSTNTTAISKSSSSQPSPSKKFKDNNFVSPSKSIPLSQSAIPTFKSITSSPPSTPPQPSTSLFSKYTATSLNSSSPLPSYQMGQQLPPSPASSQSSSFSSQQSSSQTNTSNTSSPTSTPPTYVHKSIILTNKLVEDENELFTPPTLDVHENVADIINSPSSVDSQATILEENPPPRPPTYHFSSIKDLKPITSKSKELAIIENKDDEFEEEKEIQMENNVTTTTTSNNNNNNNNKNNSNSNYNFNNSINNNNYSNYNNEGNNNNENNNDKQLINYKKQESDERDEEKEIVENDKNQYSLKISSFREVIDVDQLDITTIETTTTTIKSVKVVTKKHSSPFTSNRFKVKNEHPILIKEEDYKALDDGKNKNNNNHNNNLSDSADSLFGNSCLEIIPFEISDDEELEEEKKEEAQNFINYDNQKKTTTTTTINSSSLKSNNNIGISSPPPSPTKYLTTSSPLKQQQIFESPLKNNIRKNDSFEQDETTSPIKKQKTDEKETITERIVIDIDALSDEEDNEGKEETSIGSNVFSKYFNPNDNPTDSPTTPSQQSSKLNQVICKLEKQEPSTTTTTPISFTKKELPIKISPQLLKEEKKQSLFSNSESEISTTEDELSEPEEEDSIIPKKRVSFDMNKTRYYNYKEEDEEELKTKDEPKKQTSPPPSPKQQYQNENVNKQQTPQPQQKQQPQTTEKRAERDEDCCPTHYHDHFNDNNKTKEVEEEEKEFRHSFDYSKLEFMKKYNYSDQTISPFFDKNIKPKGIEMKDINVNVSGFIKEVLSQKCTEVVPKEMLHNFKFICQWDKKFLICEADGVVLILDQHAVSERIKLEILERKYFGENKFDLCPMPDRTRWALTEYELELIKIYSEVLESWGFKWVLNKTSIIISQVPMFCLVGLGINDLREFLYQLESNKGARSIKPPAAHRILASKACRTAVKFGDKLSRDVCIKLLADLNECNIPFQCAHGRPSIIPLINYGKLYRSVQGLY